MDSRNDQQRILEKVGGKPAQKAPVPVMEKVTSLPVLPTHTEKTTGGCYEQVFDKIFETIDEMDKFLI